MNGKVSIIVPIYKVEGYLDRCVESIVNQTYSNLEIILVDDGSPDSCPSMCDDWAKKDSRIKVIHKPNGGLSDARNAGMEVASGEYIAFVDSDDWIEHNMLEALYNEIVSTGSDIAACGIRMVWDDNSPDRILTEQCGRKVFSGTEEAMRGLIQEFCILQTVWNKLYKKERIDKIFFPVGKINEDEFWTWKAVANAEKVVFIDTPLYNYLQRSGSIMRNGSFNPYYVIEAKTERIEYIKTNIPGLFDLCCADLLYTCLFQAQRAGVLLDKKTYKMYYKKIKRVVKEYKPNRKYIKSLSLKKRLRIWCIYHCFGFVCKVQNILGIGNQSNI